MVCFIKSPFSPFWLQHLPGGDGVYSTSHYDGSEASRYRGELNGSQAWAMKISSRIRKWVREFYAALGERDMDRVDELYASLAARDLPIAVIAMDDMKNEESSQLLSLIANLRQDGIEYVRRRCPVPLNDESDQDLIKVRDDLRQIWGVLSMRHAVLGEWFGGREALLDESKWRVLFQFGMIRPTSFRGELAWAYCRHHASLAICENPDCPAPYFLANRRSQRYCCANDECTRYAGRLASSRYWKEQKKRKELQRAKGSSRKN
jgi:hypothetical protein